MDRKEYMKEYMKEYYSKNKEKFKVYYLKRRKSKKSIKRKTKKEYDYKYYSTQKGRATKLLYMYNQSDIKKNRGKGDLTAEWIVENIFSKPCAHCGETDWTKIGCNRLDNSKPHTMDNVEPCCGYCNRILR